MNKREKTRKNPKKNGGGGVCGSREGGRGVVPPTPLLAMPDITILVLISHIAILPPNKDTYR